MFIFENAPTEVLHRLTFAEKLPLGREQTFNANWASSMNAASGDAHFGAQAESVAIRESSGCIVEDTGTVHSLHELLGIRIYKMKVG